MPQSRCQQRQALRRGGHQAKLAVDDGGEVAHAAVFTWIR